MGDFPPLLFFADRRVFEGKAFGYKGQYFLAFAVHGVSD
jgi:hypothetical protein